jgi:hypothetical protein
VSVSDARGVHSIVPSRTGIGHMLKVSLHKMFAFICRNSPSTFVAHVRLSVLLHQVQTLQGWGQLINQLVQEWSTISVCREYQWCGNCIQGFGIVGRSNSSASCLTNVIRGRLLKWRIVCGKAVTRAAPEFVSQKCAAQGKRARQDV